MNLIRKYKISKLLNKPLIGIEGEIIEFIQSWLKDLIPFKWEKRETSIIYMNSERLFVLEQDNETNILWIRYENFWGVLENKYLMGYEEIQILLKFIVEETFKQYLGLPYKTTATSHIQVEEAFKQKTSLPQSAMDYPSNVEEAFKDKHNIN